MVSLQSGGLRQWTHLNSNSSLSLSLNFLDLSIGLWYDHECHETCKIDPYFVCRVVLLLGQGNTADHDSILCSTTRPWIPSKEYTTYSFYSSQLCALLFLWRSCFERDKKLMDLAYWLSYSAGAVSSGHDDEDDRTYGQAFPTSWSWDGLWWGW